MKFVDQIKHDIILGDGATGTMLQEFGLQSGECPDSWNLKKPEILQRIYEMYIQSGAKVLTTNSFGASYLRLKQHQLENQAEEINRSAAEIAIGAGGNKAWVAGSVGPTGYFLKPLGQISENEMRQSFDQQVKSLEAGGVSFIQIETMMDVREARLAAQAVRELTSLPVIISMTFNKGKDGYRTMMGTSVEQVIEAFEPLDVAALGTNCGNGIDEIIEIIREFRQATAMPLFAAPNAGKPQIVGDQVRYTQDGDYFASKLSELLSAGANYVAGCCGTTHDHIKKMSDVLKKH